MRLRAFKPGFAPRAAASRSCRERRGFPSFRAPFFSTSRMAGTRNGASFRLIARSANWRPKNAAEDFALGNAGAGLGAIAGLYKGGVGSASSMRDEGITVGALVAVNSVGSPVIPGTDLFWAFPFEQDGEFGGRMPKGPMPSIDLDLPSDMKGAARPGGNTTIAIVATDADLSRAELKRVAIMATDGFARALRPVHTPFDGDLVFAVATARHKRFRRAPIRDDAAWSYGSGLPVACHRAGRLRGGVAWGRQELSRDLSLKEETRHARNKRRAGPSLPRW